VALAIEEGIEPTVAVRAVAGPVKFQNPPLILGLVLVLTVLVLYNPVGRYPFINYDDDLYVSENAHVQQALQWDSIRWAFTTTSVANWHPLTWISYELDWQLFHQNPTGYHYVNVLLHATNACLLFLLLLQATGFLWRSWIVAALFAFHPINVESVAWIAEWKNLLSMFFFLIALIAYRWYAQRPSVARYASVGALFALGLMTKPQVITLPLVLLLWDYWPLGRVGFNCSHGAQSPAEASAMPTRSFSHLFLEKLPLFALSAASAIITLKAQRADGSVATFHQLPFLVRIGNAVVCYGRYIQKALWPSHLAVMYPYSGFSVVQIAVSVLLLILISTFAFTVHRRYLLTGWFWFLGTLVPMIGLVQVGAQSMADRYGYLPFIGLFVMLTWGLAELRARQHWPVVVPVLLCGVVLPGLALSSRHQLGYWRESVVLWSHAIEVTGPNFQAQEHLASALADDGRTKEAGQHFEAALAIEPANAKGNLNLAVYDQTQGKVEQAIGLYRSTLRLTSDVKVEGEALSNLGWAYSQVGKLQDAESTYQEAVRVNSKNHNTWTAMGLVENRLKKYEQAANAFSQAAALSPSALDYLLLENALQNCGRTSEAGAAHAKAQQLSDDLKASQALADRLLHY
jgi:protein O-mannosyl-transferase